MADTFEATTERVQDFQFEATFPGKEYDDPSILLDEPPPLGEDRGPNAARMLAAAVGNCLSASLVFCLGKADADPGHVEAHVEGTLVRNDEGRLRIGGLDVTITLPDPPGEGALDRCKDVFEDYCTVTQSVRRGLDVDVSVEA